MRESLSVRSADRDGLKVLAELLGGDEYAKRAASLLLKYADSGEIPSSELDEEVALTLEYFRVALPKSSVYGSLSWHMRTFGSDLEIPYVVRYFVRLLKSGRPDWRETIRSYFESIGEERPEDFPKIFEEIVARSRNLIVCGEDVVDISMKYGRDGGVVIAEMKGAGLISPHVGCGRFGRFGRAKAPLYEVNRFFAILLQRFP